LHYLQLYNPVSFIKVNYDVNNLLP